VAGEVVHNDDVSGAQLRHENLFDIGLFGISALGTNWSD